MPGGIGTASGSSASFATLAATRVTRSLARGFAAATWFWQLDSWARQQDLKRPDAIIGFLPIYNIKEYQTSKSLFTIKYKSQFNAFLAFQEGDSFDNLIFIRCYIDGPSALLYLSMLETLMTYADNMLFPNVTVAEAGMSRNVGKTVTSKRIITSSEEVKTVPFVSRREIIMNAVLESYHVNQDVEEVGVGNDAFELILNIRRHKVTVGTIGKVAADRDPVTGMNLDYVANTTWRAFNALTLVNVPWFGGTVGAPSLLPRARLNQLDSITRGIRATQHSAEIQTRGTYNDFEDITIGGNTWKLFISEKSRDLEKGRIDSSFTYDDGSGEKTYSVVIEPYLDINAKKIYYRIDVDVGDDPLIKNRTLPYGMKVQKRYNNKRVAFQLNKDEQMLPPTSQHPSAPSVGYDSARFDFDIAVRIY